LEREAAWGRVAQRCMNAAFRGGGVSGGGRAGLAIFTLLLKGGRRGGRRAAVGGTEARAGGGVALWRELWEVCKWGAFGVCYAGGYVAVDETLRAGVGVERTKNWRGLVAGAAVGPALFLTGGGRHTSLSIYLFLRALILLARIGNKSERAWVRTLVAPSRWEHGDTLMMCLSSGQVLYSWIMMPETLGSSYVSFLNKHGGKPTWVVKALRHIVEANRAGGRVELERALPAGVGQPGGRRGWLRARTIFPVLLQEGHNFWTHGLTFLAEAYRRSLPVYLPVYFVPALLIHRKSFFNRDLELLKKTFHGVARSSLFLASFCTLAWQGAMMTTVVSSGLFGRRSINGVWLYLTTMIPGLATLLEKKSRRMELAVYVASRAVESWANCMDEWGWIPAGARIRRLDVVMYTAASALIMHAYCDDCGRNRDVFRSKYLNVIDFIFGNVGHRSQQIRHVPSNSELAGQVVHKMRKSLSHTSLSVLMQQIPEVGQPPAAEPEESEGSQGSELKLD